MRTARDFSSGGYLFDVFPDMTPTFPRFGVSRHAGAVQLVGSATLRPPAYGPQKVRKKSSCSRSSPTRANASTQVSGTAPTTTVADRHAGAVPLVLLHAAPHEARSARTLEHPAARHGQHCGTSATTAIARSARGEYSYPNSITGTWSTARASDRGRRPPACVPRWVSTTMPPFDS